MNTTITPLAIAKLLVLLHDEQPSGEKLAFRVIPLTSGCSTPSFALEITERHPAWEEVLIKGILFTFPSVDRVWMEGLVIDYQLENNRFSIYHPNPPFLSDCQLPSL